MSGGHSDASPPLLALHEDFIARSPEMQRLLRLIEKVARTESTVLITGESGTGKEMVARLIHFASMRWERPFIAVNCGAIPDTLVESELFGHRRGAFTGAVADKKGLFQQADRGTLFLDEVAEIPLLAQVKLLRALQQREVRAVGSEQATRVDVRVLAATNKPVHDAVARGELREDLYYRLNVLHVEIPPLRERRDDVLPLAEHFLQRYAEQERRGPMTLSADAKTYLLGYDFPGNVRELENAIYRAVALADTSTIEVRDLPPTIYRQRMLPASTAEDSRDTLTLAEVEREHILRVVKRHHGNVGKAAKALAISRTTLWRKLNEYGRDALD